MKTDIRYYQISLRVFPEERAGYIADFLKVSGGVLLASDAASRGLDFPRIDWIIQYDPPRRTVGSVDQDGSLRDFYVGTCFWILFFWICCYPTFG